MPLIERHLQDFQALSGPTKRRRAIDLEAEIQECFPLFQAQAGRQNVRLVVKSRTHGKLARAEMRPELGRCLLVLLFEHALQDVAAVHGGRASKVGSRKSDGSDITLTVWATNERAGVDYRVAGGRSGRTRLPGRTVNQRNAQVPPRRRDLQDPRRTSGSLALVMELCASLGGELTVRAGRGEGATYRLDFRRKQARATR